LDGYTKKEKNEKTRSGYRAIGTSRKRKEKNFKIGKAPYCTEMIFTTLKLT
jgi:hypothetical protein